MTEPKFHPLATFFCGNCKIFGTAECGHVNSATGKKLVSTDVACMLDFEIVDEPLTEEELKEN
jgi:hypothetical protein